MPSLAKSLQNSDLGHLQIVAEAWGLELEARDAQSALSRLVEGMLDAELVEEMVVALPSKAQSALEALQQNGGRLSWAQFERRFGEVREVGPGRRDRQRPDRSPISPAEILWYRALIARAFFDTPAGPEEFAYIPEDLLSLIPSLQEEEVQTEGKEAERSPLGRPATPKECAHPLLVSDRILDDACTLLAALRLGISPSTHMPISPAPSPPCSPFLLEALLATAGYLDEDRMPRPEEARRFLEAPRGQALTEMGRAWLESPTHNDLHLVPHLKAEGEWKNDPLRTRETILGFLRDIPSETWWSLSAFVAAVHQLHPDFQRPAGDYNSWFLRDERTGEFLRGFEHWENVEGALIRYMITGPLHWLGILDLAVPEEGTDSAVTAFRWSRWASVLLHGEPPQELAEETALVHVRSNGRVGIPRLVKRSVRYQIARFCQWIEEVGEEYRYRLTPSSLERAREQGLEVRHLLALLRNHAETIPPNVLESLSRWEKYGTQARMERVTVLRLGSPELLQTLRQSRAARFLGDPLGPASVIVKPGAQENVLAVLMEMGYLGEESGDD